MADRPRDHTRRVHHPQAPHVRPAADGDGALRRCLRRTITLDEQEPSSAQAEVTIGAASIDTRNARRDKHLRTVDFFHVEQHPHLTFKSRRIEAVDRAAGTYRVTGDLTVRGVTREVTLDAHYTPPVAGAREPRIKLTLTAPLNRRDFGIVWNKPYIDVADDLTVTARGRGDPRLHPRCTAHSPLTEGERAGTPRHRSARVL